MIRKLFLAVTLVCCCLGLTVEAQGTTPTLPDMPYIFYGGTGYFQFQILANGVPYTAPAGYTPAVAWSSSDPNVTLTPSADTLSVTALVAKTDTATSFVITGVCKAPDGTTLTETLTVPLSVMPVVYTAALIQTGSIGPR